MVQVRQNVPRVSYISYLDIWMLLCMLFVFSCILEFIMATALLRTGKKEKAEKVISRIFCNIVKMDIFCSSLRV